MPIHSRRCGVNILQRSVSATDLTARDACDGTDELLTQARPGMAERMIDGRMGGWDDGMDWTVDGPNLTEPATPR